MSLFDESIKKCFSLFYGQKGIQFKNYFTSAFDIKYMCYNMGNY